MVGVLVKSSDSQLNHIFTELETFHEQSEINIGELSEQVNSEKKSGNSSAFFKC